MLFIVRILTSQISTCYNDIFLIVFLGSQASALWRETIQMWSVWQEFCSVWYTKTSQNDSSKR